MSLSCDPGDLQLAAKAFKGLSPQQNKWVQTYLLALKAGGSTDPETLSNAAKVFKGVEDGVILRIMAYLLCQIASGGGGGSVQDMQVAWTPTNVKLGQLFSFQATNTDQLAGITSLTFSQATIADTVDIESQNDLTSVSFPNLTAITNVFRGITISNCPNVTSVLLPSLISSELILGALGITSLALPNFVSCNGAINVGNTLGLTTISLPLFVPENGDAIQFQNNALPASFVNLILHKCVANAAYVSGNVLLDGQTPAAPPSGQGIADKATLIGRGVTVTTD